MNFVPALTCSLFFGVASLGCSAEGTSPSSSPAPQPSGGTAQRVVGGVTIPTAIKRCTQSLTAVSSSTKAGFSWKAVPTATRYAVLATKAPRGATTLTELFNGIVDGTPNGGSYDFPERVSGTSYTIEVYALAGSDPVCQLDGVNGITA